MSQSPSSNGQHRMEQLPYYQEYVEQILKPRVLRLMEDVRARLAEHAWQDLLVFLAQEQGESQPDPETLGRLRGMLESSLGLQIDVQANVQCAGGNGKAASHGENVRRVEPGEPRQNVEVVDRTFPDNPLARAVGSVRRVNR